MTITEPSASVGRAVTEPDDFTTLDALESEAIHIFREVAGEFERPVILFSGGKDSTVLLHLALKAFWPAPLPFSLLHVDTGHNLPEVLEFRDQVVERHNLRLHVAKVEDYLADGRLEERADGIRNPLQTVPLLDAISASSNPEAPATIWFETSHDSDDSLPVRLRPQDTLHRIPRGTDGSALVEAVRSGGFAADGDADRHHRFHLG